MKLNGLGGFVIVERAPRLGRNPKTGNEISIPANGSIKVKPAKPVRSVLNPSVDGNTP